MDVDDEEELNLESETPSPQNAFTGSRRESNEAPGVYEPVCLISYEITFILQGDGPRARRDFWKHYRRELALNLKTDYHNYHVRVCRHQLTSLRMNLDQPVYFRNNRLTTEKQIDPFGIKLLGSEIFQ